MSDKEQIEYLKHQLTLATQAQDSWRTRYQSENFKYQALLTKYNTLVQDITNGVNQDDGG